MKPEVVVVTGASAGVGRATVQAFARRGAHIGLLTRGVDGLEGARRDAEALGGKGLVVPTDVADADQVERAAAAVENEFGPIDVWVNDAMASVFSPVKEMTADDYRRVTEVTYLGYVYGTLAALRRMLPRDRGIIIQVGSALAYRGIPLQTAYCGAKHAIQGFTESLRCELIHDRSQVKISIVQMPALNTPQFSWVKSRLPRKPQPVPPIYQPEVAAEAIVWAAPITGANGTWAAPRPSSFPPTRSRRGSATGISARRVFNRSSARNPPIPTGRITSMSRCRAIMARTANSIPSPTASACNFGRTSTAIGWPLVVSSARWADCTS